ncbi:unnamed protein product [Trichobilharzia regenti]|nr:unnamed protein product [Trichobilharzia regenti]
MNKMSLEGNSREVVFVKAKLGTEGGTDQYKKFAIDPNITDYKVLLGLLCKCFNINSDFSICYLAVDEFGEQFYLPLQSDWDLDASIITSADSTLRLKITQKPKVPGMFCVEFFYYLLLQFLVNKMFKRIKIRYNVTNDEFSFQLI